MTRHLFSLIIMIAVLSSCSNTVKKEVASKGSESAIQVEFASLADNPDNYVGKNIIVEGKVVHVCTESGKKLFIVGDNPDIRLYIAAGEDMPKFRMELLGSTVVVEGLITKVGGQAMAEAEMQPKSMEVTQAPEGAPKTAEGDNCETETALTSQPKLAEIVMEYKSHTVK